jgi:hypothetical protein
MKELHYFCGNYSKGPDWYEHFFPIASDAQNYKAIGDVSPGTLYNQQAPQRIREYGSIERFLVIVREPLARAVSSYKLSQQYSRFEGSFEEFMTTHPKQVEHGRYALYLEPFLQEFGHENCHIMIFEEAIADITGAKQRLSAFLSLSPDAFPPGAGEERVNDSRMPRLPGTYALMVKTSQYLQKRNLYWLTNLGRSIGLKSLLVGRKRAKVEIEHQVLEHYRSLYTQDNADLEDILGRKISAWAV